MPLSFSDAEDEASKAIAVLQGSRLKKSLSLEELTISTPFFGQGGIRSADLASICFIK